ncbi:uncharacterized protein LOC132720519 [Ruditapes philippinarum]|uniref:uncharacterized protein LOC132720519 n=1 Tax=Ruditapes philippinarum TaxID=129788 RepID=UPI00295BD367|nr:uncharacterized protein LOC132720519 [Ruditapes philippinarum]
MYSSYTTLPLMDTAGNDDLFANKAFDYDYEDSSSGYESSDMESVSSWGSRDSLDSRLQDSHNNFLPMNKDEEIMNFRSTHSLSEHLKLILAMPEIVMYQLILKHMSMEAADKKRNAKSNKKSKKGTCKAVGRGRSLSQRLVIPVKKYDSEVFRMLVQFIHCGIVNITEETVAGLFCAASHFELPDLSKACLDFIERCMKVGRAEKLLFSTRCYSQHKASKTLFDRIYSVVDKRCIGKLEETPV